MSGKRFVWLWIPDAIDRMAGWRDPVYVRAEGPRDNGFAEVRLATDAEVGLWTRKALPPARTA